MPAISCYLFQSFQFTIFMLDLSEVDVHVLHVTI